MDMHICRYIIKHQELSIDNSLLVFVRLHKLQLSSAAPLSWLPPTNIILSLFDCNWGHSSLPRKASPSPRITPVSCVRAAWARPQTASTMASCAPAESSTSVPVAAAGAAPTATRQLHFLSLPLETQHQIVSHVRATYRPRPVDPPSTRRWPSPCRLTSRL